MQKRQLAKEITVLVARMSFIVVSRIFVLAGFGVLLNIVLLVIDARDVLAYLDASAPSMPIARAGGVGAIFALVFMLFYMIVHNPLFICVLLLFLVGFPLAHLLVAKKYAIASALMFALRRKQADLVEYIVERTLDAAARHPQWHQWLTEGGVAHALDRFLPSYSQRLGNMPFPLRMALRPLLKKSDFAATLLQKVRAAGLRDLELERLPPLAASAFSEHVSEKLFQARLTTFWILTGVNILYAVAIKLGASAG